MNVFDKAISRIFKDKNLVDVCILNGTQYTVIKSKTIQDISYNIGSVDEENFTLDLQLPIFPMVKQNDRITYRNKQYRISHFQVDSTETSVKLYIITNSKGK